MPRKQLNSLFYDVADKCNSDTNVLSFESGERIDPRLVKRILGRSMSEDEKQQLQDIADSAPKRHYLELSTAP